MYNMESNYFEDMLAADAKSLEEDVLLPSKSNLMGKRYDKWDRSDRERAVDSATGPILVTHTDADGLVSGALFKDALTDVTVLSVDYGEIEETFEYILENYSLESEDEVITPLREVYVADLNLDTVPDVVSDLADTLDSFVWLDHHEWGDKKDTVNKMGVEIFVDRNRCGASLVASYLEVRHGYSLTESAQTIIDLTEDHDLWIHESELVDIGNNVEINKSKLLADLAFFSKDAAFMDTILEAGDDFMEYQSEFLRDSLGDNYIIEKTHRHLDKVEYIIGNETTVKDIGQYTVAFAHGKANPGTVFDRLVESDSIDILVHTKPAYPVKASLRSTDNFPHVHEVAERLNGGGHENASGCSPDNLVTSPMEFFQYVVDKGEPLQERIEVELEQFIRSKETTELTEVPADD